MKPLAVAPLVAALAAVVVAAGCGSRGGPSHHASPWLVISSNRDGDEYGLGNQAYAIRPDGSGLTSLLGRESPLNPVDVSPDGRLIAYHNWDSNAIYVSRADGTGLRRVLRPSGLPFRYDTFSPDGSKVAIVRDDGDGHPHLVVVDADGNNLRSLGRAGPPDWSPDGSLLAFHTMRGCVVTTAAATSEQGRIPGRCGYPEFSPDGASLAFETEGRCAVVTTPSPGRLAALARERRLLPGKCDGPQWSPDGRWIAYVSPGCAFCESHKAQLAARKELGVWIVHPDGSGRRRVAPADEENGAVYSWSPDASRLAIAGGSRLMVASPTGPARRLGLVPASDSSAAPLWSSDSSRLTVAARSGNDPPQIWSIRVEGTELHRLTSAGVNDLVGLVDTAPARSPVPALEPSERVLGPRLLGTGKPIGRLAADGGSVAYIADSTETDCEHVSVWTPTRARILRVSQRLPAPCDDYEGGDVSVYELALAGAMVGWSTNLGCGNSGCGVDVHTARLPDANPVEADFDDGTDYGNEFLRPFDPVGRGRVFAVESHVRVAEPNGGVRRCVLPGDRYADAVDGGRLAVPGHGEELLLDDRCQVVGRVPLDTKRLKTVLLDGSRLIAARARWLEVYDTNGGSLTQQRPLEPGTVLDGAAGGVAVLRRGTAVTAVRLADGRSVTFRPCLGPVLAAIGGAGLYYSYRTPNREGRLALVPRRELERRLATGASYEPRCLRSAREFATGGGPVALGAGDLDGDGRPDLVTANEEGRSISVLPGPAFGPRRDYPLGGDPTSVVVSDLDGDGDLDVAAALGSTNAVAVLINRGDGSFPAPRRYRTGRGPGALVAGDLDGDGAPDLVAGSSLDGALSIFRNRGDGTFGPRRKRGVGSSSSSLAITDVDGNGTADVVVGHGSESSVTVLEGAGDGTFPRARAVASPNDGPAVTVADLNADGRPDLALLRDCTPVVMLARPRGGFSKPHELPHEDCGGAGASESTGDVNGDRRADLVVATEASGFPLRLTVYLNRGRAGLMPVGEYEVPSLDNYATSALVHDLDGDGRAELAVPVYDRSSIEMLTNTLGVCHVRAFRGITVAAAARRLGSAGCRLGRARRVRTRRIAKGRVGAAVPRFGAFWPNGPEVDLLVSG